MLTPVCCHNMHPTFPASYNRLRLNGGRMCIKVLVANNSELMRRGIKSFLKDREDIYVIGEASNLREAIRKTAELLPDV